MIDELLVSKINNIRVMQADESKLNFDNKKTESKKPSLPNGAIDSKSSGGENTTVDLGAGALKYVMKVYAFSETQADDLFNILYKERYCTITDKFFGKIKVYVDSVERTNSDKHIGKTIFVIGATVQDVKKIPIIDKTGQLKSAKDALYEKVNEKSEDLTKTISTTDRAVNELTLANEFVDKTLKALEDGLLETMDVVLIVSDIYNGIQSKIARIQRISDALDLITTVPQDFIDLMLDMTNEQTARPMQLFTTPTSTEANNLSQIELREIQKIVTANDLLNTITAVSEINQVLDKEYKSQQEFDNQVNICLARLEIIIISYDDKHRLQDALKAYSNEKKLKKIIDYEIKKATPLVSIIYDLYGNLDFYDDIRTLNNFADNDAIIGTIKVFNNESSS